MIVSNLILGIAAISFYCRNALFIWLKSIGARLNLLGFHSPMLAAYFIFLVPKFRDDTSDACIEAVHLVGAV